MIVDDFKLFAERNKELFSDDVLGLFTDSIRCFNAGIYRPAYIMTYQAMMLHFREIILSAKKPDGYDENLWKGVIQKTSNDKSWDEQVFTACKQKNEPTATPPKVAILDMPDEIRPDFDFWRSRRNDCAHYKSYVINDAHVLALYSFIMQYLMKISVEGGMNTLLREFKDAFDPSKTSPSTSLQPLIDKISTRVQIKDMCDFFERLEDISDFKWINKFYQVLRNILNGQHEDVKRELIKYIRKNILLDFLSYNADMVGFVVEKNEVRNLWYEKLRDVRNRCAIVANMLLLGLIDKSEIEEAIKTTVMHCYNKDDGLGELSERETQILLSNGLFDVISKTYIEKEMSPYEARDNGKCHYQFFSSYLFYMPIQIEYVKPLVELFARPNYPFVWLNILKERYLSNEEHRASFKKICDDDGLAVPTWVKMS